MIKSFRHKGLKAFFQTGDKSGIQAHHETRLRLQLAKLEAVQSPDDMDLPREVTPAQGEFKPRPAIEQLPIHG